MEGRLWLTFVLGISIFGNGAPHTVMKKIGDIDFICPHGWFFWGTNCYKMVNKMMEWQDSVEVCKSYLSMPLIIKDEVENDEMAKLAMGSSTPWDRFWVGEKVKDKCMGFWDNNQPPDDVGEDDCAAVYNNGRWRVVPCESRLPFFCTKPACVQGTFDCGHGNCLNSNWECDGVNDCGNNLDEMNCPSKCSYTYTDPSKEIDFFSTYSSNSDCMWTIIGDPGTQIVATFSTIRLEQDVDTLEVLVGHQVMSEAKVIERLTGSLDNKVVYSNNHIMLLRLMSDSSINSFGFRLTWSTAAPELATEAIEITAGTTFTLLKSPFYPSTPPSGFRREWIVTSSDDSIVTVQIDPPDLSPKWSIVIYDGEGYGDLMLKAEKVSDLASPAVYISTSNKIRIIVKGEDTSGGGQGVTLQVKNGCNVDISSATGEVKSPGYEKSKYPTSVTCSWVLRAPVQANRNIKINFLDLKLVADNADYIQVFDGSSDTAPSLQTTNYTGDMTSSLPTLKGGKILFVKFVSSLIQDSGKFRFKFSVDCPEIPISLNMEKSTNDTSFGTSVQLSCDEGYSFRQQEYYLKPSVVFRCEEEGKWDMVRFPTCQIIYCGAPEAISFGSVYNSTGAVTYNNRVRYQCNKGFTMQGSAEVICLNTGNWSTSPNCVSSNCGNAPSVLHATVKTITETDGKSYGTIVEYTCNEGYEIIGTPRRLCQTNFQWSDSAPTCERIKCPLPVVKHGTLSGSLPLQYQESTTLTCDKGYVATTNNRSVSTLTCLASRTVAEVQCVDENECEASAFPCSSNQMCHNKVGSYECTCKTGYRKTDSGSCIDIDECGEKIDGCTGNCFNTEGSKICGCDSGYDLFENGTNGFYVLPGETGMRINDVYHIKHTCVPKVCTKPSALINGVVHSLKTRFLYQEKVMFTCKLGYVLKGVSERECQANGQWSDSMPVCEVAKCPMQNEEGSADQRAMVNRILPTTQVEFGQQVFIECNRPDTSKFNKTRFCAFDRTTKMYTLQGDDPKCPVVDCGPVKGIAGLNPPSLSSTVFGQTFSFTCQTGAIRSGTSLQNNNDVKCMENGRWGYDSLTCTAAKCPDPGTRAGTKQTYESYEQGKMIHYECVKSGYTLTSKANLTCVYSGSQANWDGNPPTCSDTTNPVIGGCTEPQLVAVDKMGRPNFAVPTATDNSGFVSTLTVSPPGFNPNDPVWQATDVTYTATDGDGNSAQCQYKILVKDYSPGILTCPAEITYEATDIATTYNISEKLTFSGGQLTTNPTIIVSLANVGSTTDYRVTLRTNLGTETTCAFKVHIVSGGCYESLLSKVNNANQVLDNSGDNLRVTLSCFTGYAFSNGDISRLYTCTGKNQWSPALPLESCILYTAPEFTYEVSLKLNTEDSLLPDAVCRSRFSSLYNAALSSSSAPINNHCKKADDSFYRFTVSDAKFTEPIQFTSHGVALTMKVTNNDGAVAALENCKTSINTNKATLFAMDSNGCKFIVNVGSSSGIYNSGESCEPGYTITTVGSGKQCLPCSPGTYLNSDGECQTCPDGEYQDVAGQGSCKTCGVNKVSLIPRITSARCVDKCLNGFFSTSGSPPCKPCPVDTYWSSSNKCESCPAGGSTLNVQGATNTNQCREPCPIGQYSRTGYTPCTQCPLHFYQDQTAQMQCKECAQGSVTSQLGSVASSDCKVGQTTSAECSPVCNSTGGTCQYLYHRLTCTCKPGYTGSKCDTLINHCQSNPCFNGAVCTPGLNDYTCNCPGDEQCSMVAVTTKYQDLVSFIVSYSNTNLDTCKAQCVARSDCVSIFFYSNGFCTLHNSAQDGTKKSTGSATSNYFSKQCPQIKYYSGRNCEKDDKDDCADNNCDAASVCRDLVNSFECVCPSGGEFFQPRCERNTNLCNPNPCKNSGLCNSGDGVRYQCTCLKGYTGDNCETNIDECEMNPDGCMYGGTCADSVDSYSCACQPGFSGSNCQNVRDFCLSGACSGGICLNNYVNLTSDCICENPFEKGSNGLCTRMNFCASSPCRNSTYTQRCDSLPDGYRCVCQPGYEGTLCQHNIDDCASKPCVHGTCVDGVNTYACQCEPGWTGGSCNLDVKDCLGQCPGARTLECRDLNQDYECVCRPGFTGKNCTEDLNECDSFPCQHGGNCTDGSADYSCSCEPGWTGKNCETMLDECTRQAITCLNDGICYSHFTSAFCSCKKGTQGDRCETSPQMCSMLPPCTAQGSCRQTGGTAMCTCNSLYSGVSCELIKDQCASPGETCKNGGQCSLRDPRGYSCTCMDGYSGETCETKVDACAAGSCPSQTICVSEGQKSYCACPAKRIPSGQTCKDASSDFDLYTDPMLGPVKVRSATPFQLFGDMTLLLWIGYFNGNRSVYISNIDDTETYFELWPEMVKFKIGDKEKVVVMEKGSLKSVEGQWDHVVLTWTKSGDFKLILNAVQVASGTTDFNLTMSESLKVVRFDSHFNGFVSQLTVWREILSEDNIVESTRNILFRPVTGDLALGWRQYHMTGGVRRFAPSGAQLGKLLCQDGRPKYSSCPNLPKKMRPTLSSCPREDVTKEITDRTIEVINVFSKPGAASSVMTTLTDELVMKGRYDVVYASKDESGNYGFCRFKVYIKGTSSCSKTGFPVTPTPCGTEAITGLCSSGNAPSVPTPNILRCGKLGSFNLMNPREPFIPPVCGVMSAQKFSAKITLIYVLKVNCITFTVGSIKTEISGRFVNNVKTKWPKLCTNGCDNMVVNARCDAKNVVVDVTFSNLDEKIADKDNTVMLRPDEILKITAIETTDLQLKDFGTLQTGKEQVVVLLLPSCSSLQAVSGGICVSCGPGSFFNSTSSSCEVCPVGSYADAFGQSSCTLCGEKTTLLSGARLASACVDKCSAGQYYKDGGCQPCPRDFFQAMEGKSFCNPCPLNRRTKDPGTVSETLCFPDCSSGSELLEDGSCKDCAQGFFRTQSIHDKCQMCSGGNTTEGPKTTSSSGCILPGCEKGNYISDQRVCLPCPTGTYQPEKWQRACINCSNSYTTVDEGATNETMCKFLCPVGQEESPVGSKTCKPCPIGKYRDGSLSQRFLLCQECPPGFTTDGTGAKNKTNDCTIRICLAGNYRNVTDNKCYPCPIGQYQPNDLQTSCTKCNDSYSTTTVGSVLEATSCKFFCPDGQEVDSAEKETCVDCPRGKYRSNTDALRFQPCQTCTGDKTTETSKSKLATECNIKKCTAGQKLSSSKLACEDCLADSYQPDDLPNSSTDCITCGLRKGTEQAKSTSSAQCFPYCDVGQQVKGTECELCPQGTWNDGSAQKRFKPCEACPDSDYTTADRGGKSALECTLRNCDPGYKIKGTTECEVCGYGNYQPARASSSCLECGPDLNTSTTTADSKDKCTISCPQGRQGQNSACSPCPPDTFKDKVGYDVCEQCTGDKTSDANRITCDVTYCDAGVGYSSDTKTCSPCVKGFYKEGRGNQPCLQCPKNFTTPSTKTKTAAECSELNCEAGFYAHQTPICTLCPVGFYKSAVGPQNCTMCDPDKTTSGEGATSASACTLAVCPAGQYRNADNSCPFCPVGEYQPNSGSTGCMKCSDGYTTAGEGSKLDTDCLIVCKPGKYRSARDACSDCEKGQYQPNSGATSCFNCTEGYTTENKASDTETLCYRTCPAGKFRPSTDRTLCNDCPLGQYQPSTGQISCVSCDLNFSTLQTASTSANQCMPKCSTGKYLDVAQRTCKACPLGTYQPQADTNVQECTKCQEGKTTSDTGSTVSANCNVDDCQPGYFRKEGEGCQACGQGFYQPLKAQLSCLQCNAGLTTRLTETTSTSDAKCIKDCPSGQEYDVIEKDCDLCPVGQIRDKTSSDFCVNCPVGQSTGQVGATNCIPAPTPTSGVNARIRVVGRMRYQASSCDNPTVIEYTIRTTIFFQIKRMSEKFPNLCIRANCGNIIITFVTRCIATGTGRRKRNTQPIVAEVAATDLPERIENTDNTVSRTGASLIKEALTDTDPVTKDLTAAGITAPTLTSVGESTVCLSGSRLVDKTCVPCAAGSFHNTSADQCQPCAVNEYQDKTGQTTCTPCPTSLSTRATGSTAASNCLAKCALTTDYCKNGGVCLNGGCQCTEYYTGEDCTSRQTVESNLQWIIIGVCVGIFVLLLAILTIGYFCCRKPSREEKSRDRHSMYSPSTGVPDYMQSPFVRNDYLASQGYVQYPNPEFNDAYDFYKSGRGYAEH